ncbi:succinate dehydrogenase, cytochrome b556 subunit [Thiohalorhabdus sp. Cl-TMA]|uniref:Succinate dehydrogenase cytochrome b556 subunit n=2 Tax=Thiohalorhabdus methylotrophus TaxID=3242694 RepID=A0ABV4TXQ4_9GAMM
MAMKPTDPFRRPIFLDLLRIRFPVGAWASILHRITGILLILAIPASLFLMAYSARSAAHFRQTAAWLENGWVELVLALVLGAVTHHLLAGVRILLMDAGIGLALPAARRTAWGSLVLAGLAVVGALILFWAYPGGAHVP